MLSPRMHCPFVFFPLHNMVNQKFWEMALVWMRIPRAWRLGANSNSGRCSYSAKTDHVTQGYLEHVTLSTCAKEVPSIESNDLLMDTKHILPLNWEIRILYLTCVIAIKSTRISELISFGGPEKGRLGRVVQIGKKLKPWQPSRTSWAEEQPGCWGEHHPGQW